MNQVADLERKLKQLRMEPDNSEIFNETGVILYQLGDWENSELYLERAYRLNPDHHDILYNYAFILYLNSRFEKAIPVLEAYLKLHEGNTEIMEKLGASCYLAGKYEAASGIYERLQAGKGDMTYGMGEAIKSLLSNQK